MLKDNSDHINVDSEFARIAREMFLIQTKNEFEDLAFRVFRLQYKTNEVYKQFVDLLKINPLEVKKLEQIPFLPISLFKYNKVISGKKKHEIIFYSSGTTGKNPSKHYVFDPKLYLKSIVEGFSHFYGNPSDYCILALLPGYLERKGSSLIYMVNELMKISGHPENGFFLDEFELVENKIRKLKRQNQKYILIGVTYALLDFANLCKLDLGNGFVIETGGMKGKREEMIKAEVHHILKSKLKIANVHSEYGMTELLSQAYSKGNGLFNPPPWMKVMIRDVYDPFRYVQPGISGGINIIDLANLYSCSFVETKDLGKTKKNGQFEILGRFDNSDIRGCNLLIS